MSTTDGMSAKAAQITVAPRDKAATFEIARMDNNIVITSKAGALMVTEAGKTTELEAGASSSRTAEPTPAPAPAPMPQAAPVFPGSTLSGRQVFAIAAVVAGAAVATGLWAGMSAAGIPPEASAISCPRSRTGTRHEPCYAQRRRLPVRSWQA